MRRNLKIYFILLFSLGLLNGCYKDKEQLLSQQFAKGTNTGNCTNYSFATTVNPIFQSTCAGSTACHGAGSSSGPGALTTYAAIKADITNIQASIAAGRMPLGNSLTASQIQIINCWISNGALNN